MSKSERDQALDALVTQEMIAEGRDALQAQDRARRGRGSTGGGGGASRGGATNDLDNSPSGPE